MKVGDWIIDSVVDSNGILTLWIQHQDGTSVSAMDTDVSMNESEWGERFTTDMIEETCRERGYDNE